jgi:DNA invertase Pin-like site-specific DNA recombinase
MGKHIGYIRVSTDKQNFELQKDSIKNNGCYRIFSDVASGVKAARPGLTECLDYLREGDTLVVWKSDRLGRSTVDLLNRGAEPIPAKSRSRIVQSRVR